MNPYEILEVNQDATYDEIKTAFKAKAKTVHPSVNPNPDAEKAFDLLVEAYNVLTDPKLRAEYDARLTEDVEVTEEITETDVNELRRLIKEQTQPYKSEAMRYMLAGVAWLVGGLAVTGISVWVGYGVIAFGAIIFGGIQAVRGFVHYAKVSSACKNFENEFWNSININPNSVTPVNNAIRKEVKTSGTQKKHKVLPVVLIALCIVVIGGILLMSITSTKDIIIQGGQDIVIEEGENLKLELDGPALSVSDYDDIEWRITDTDGHETSKIITLKNNEIKAKSPGVVYIKGELEKGARSWEGMARITVNARPMVINSGKLIKIKVGESKLPDVEIEGVDSIDYSKLKWKSSDKSVVKIKNGKLYACGTGSTEISCTYKSGKKQWSSTARVKATYRKVKFSNGEMVKAAYGYAPVKINAPESENCYVYFESTSGGSDFSFLVKAGKSAEVAAPLGTYKMYYASGNTWYGPKYLFGKNTSYAKADETFKFYESGGIVHGTEVTLYNVLNGNLSTDYIDESEFPN